MDAPIVRELQGLGVEFAAGDWSDETALTTAITGCSHLFLNLIPSMAATFSSEVPHAKRILAIAKASGVKHIIYSSGMSVSNPEEREFYDPNSLVAKALGWKKEIEGLVRTAGFETWTILRGGFFMANFLQPKVRMYPGLVETSTWTTAMQPQTRIPIVDTDDIGKFAVVAFCDPARFHKKEVPIAGEVLTPDELMQQLGEANGRDMRNVFLTDEEIEAQRATNIFVAGQLMSRDLDKCVDLEETRSWGIPLGTFKEFLKRESKAVKETYP
jgi:uncharacterized protein YbjT (DUF2867 family)